jgi:hypothetical protein
MTGVFVSYSSADKNRVAPLVKSHRTARVDGVVEWKHPGRVTNQSM